MTQKEFRHILKSMKKTLLYNETQGKIVSNHWKVFCSLNGALLAESTFTLVSLNDDLLI